MRSFYNNIFFYKLGHRSGKGQAKGQITTFPEAHLTDSRLALVTQNATTDFKDSVQCIICHANFKDKVRLGHQRSSKHLLHHKYIEIGMVLH